MFHFHPHLPSHTQISISNLLPENAESSADLGFRNPIIGDRCMFLSLNTYKRMKFRTCTTSTRGFVTKFFSSSSAFIKIWCSMRVLVRKNSKSCVNSYCCRSTNWCGFPFQGTPESQVTYNKMEEKHIDTSESVRKHARMTCQVSSCSLEAKLERIKILVLIFDIYERFQMNSCFNAEKYSISTDF